MNADFRHGAGGGIRTHDLRFRRPLLYPAELLPLKFLRGAVFAVFPA